MKSELHNEQKTIIPQKMKILVMIFESNISLSSKKVEPGCQGKMCNPAPWNQQHETHVKLNAFFILKYQTFLLQCNVALAL